MCLLELEADFSPYKNVLEDKKIFFRDKYNLIIYNVFTSIFILITLSFSWTIYFYFIYINQL